MIEFIEIHYKIIAGIVVPIIVAIIGILKITHFVRKKNAVKGNSNNLLAAEKNINSFNTTKQSNGTIQVVGNNNQINTFDRETIQILAQTFTKTMYPYAERGFAALSTNVQNFLANFNQQLEQLSSSDMEKFSEVDVQIALKKAIEGAARTDSTELHDLLSKLVADRVQKPKMKITELAINQSIEVTAKLDINLIKILAFSFILSRTKYLALADENALMGKLSKIQSEFKDIEVSSSKFEYLEAISCGKITSFSSGDLVKRISETYPQLFRKSVSLQQVEDLAIPSEIKSIILIKQTENKFILKPLIGLYLFEDVQIQWNNSPLNISEDVKEQIKIFYKNNSLDKNEIIAFLESSNLINIINLWDKNAFPMFSLTAVGIAIGRAYLEKKKLGNFDINIWIN